jgi:hypothetical protein
MEISKLHFAWLSCHLQSAKALKSFNIESQNVLRNTGKSLNTFSIEFFIVTTQK